MKISAFFPCHNEALNIERVANAAAGVLADVADDYEIIVVDDGSVDDTRAAALRLAGQNPRIRVVSHERNMGYGAALRTGFAACRLEYVFFTDGDGQFDMQELRRLLPFVPQHDLVIGWRRQRRDPSIRRLYAGLYNCLVRALLGLRARDINCAFKLIKKQVLSRIEFKTTGALTSAELLVKAKRLGFKTKELPVVHYPRLAGQQSGGNPRVIFRMFSELLLNLGSLRR